MRTDEKVFMMKERDVAIWERRFMVGYGIIAAIISCHRASP
jgi:hypothetical protein